jgi:hypothetical protein
MTETLKEMENRLKAANAEWEAKKQAKLAQRSTAEAIYPHLKSTIAEQREKGKGK